MRKPIEPVFPDRAIGKTSSDCERSSSPSYCVNRQKLLLNCLLDGMLSRRIRRVKVPPGSAADPAMDLAARMKRLREKRQELIGRDITRSSVNAGRNVEWSSPLLQPKSSMKAWQNGGRKLALEEITHTRNATEDLTVVYEAALIGEFIIIPLINAKRPVFKIEGANQLQPALVLAAIAAPVNDNSISTVVRDEQDADMFVTVDNPTSKETEPEAESRCVIA
ncbi:hypothetical protein B0H13DRAFT_1875411 [Mycena leptocephala]|nr:hypothetical protein B0H13DRAFT_1875411 [Mycena leptocephala]